MAAAVAVLVAFDRGQHAVAGELPDRGRQAGLAVAQQRKRTSGFKAVSGFQRGTAETPARTCASPGGGGLEQQDGFQLAIVLVQDGQHLCVVAFGGLRLRLRNAAGTGQREQGNSNGSRTRAHRCLMDRPWPAKFPSQGRTMLADL